MRSRGVVAFSAAGFTILELVIAIALLCAVGAALMQISAMASKGNVQSKDFAVASALAAEKLEELKNRGYTALSSGSETGLTAAGATGGLVYSRDWAISSEYRVAGSPAKTMTVTVRWQPSGVLTFSTRMVNPTGAFSGRSPVIVEAWDQQK